jgi:hypothetical protein
VEKFPPVITFITNVPSEALCSSSDFMRINFRYIIAHESRKRENTRLFFLPASAFLAYSQILKIEAKLSCETTLSFGQTTRRHMCPHSPLQEPQFELSNKFQAGGQTGQQLFHRQACAVRDSFSSRLVTLTSTELCLFFFFFSSSSFFFFF